MGENPPLPSPTNQAHIQSPAGTAGARRPYLHDITIAKGLGIFLVVFGHLVTGWPPQGNNWYMMLRAAVYAFHMPFFIYLSGYIFAYTGAFARFRSNRSAFLLSRAKRLLIPFFTFGILIIVGKHALQNIIHVDNVSGSIFTDFLNIFWDTRQSAAKSIWFIFVLFEITLFLCIVMTFIRNIWVMFAISLTMQFLNVPDILYLDRFAFYLPFFVAGMIAASNLEQWTRLLDKYHILFAALFVGAVLFTRWLAIIQISVLLCGFLSLPALHALSRSLLSRSRFFEMLGTYSFVIYLLNTITIGLAKGIMFRFMSWDYGNFLIFFPILLTAGIAGPILIKRYIFSLWKPADDYTN